MSPQEIYNRLMVISEAVTAMKTELSKQLADKPTRKRKTHKAAVMEKFDRYYMGVKTKASKKATNSKPTKQAK